MSKRVVVTGRAGFIGSQPCDEMLQQGCRVRALDALAQVHGPDRRRPSCMGSDIDLRIGDVRDRDVRRGALAGVGREPGLEPKEGIGRLDRFFEKRPGFATTTMARSARSAAAAPRSETSPWH